MNGKEYTDRLLEDISKTIEVRKKVNDPFTQVKMIGLTGQATLNEFFTALNVWEIDAHLDILSQFINISERLVDHNKGDKVDISIFQRDISENRIAISKVIQQILDNKKLIDSLTGRPISEFLIKELNSIHEASN